jgi:hypothetical protein
LGRVTRLGEFSPIVWLFSLVIFIIYKSRSNFGATFYYCKSDVIILTKNGLGYILGVFLTIASGRLGFGANFYRFIILTKFRTKTSDVNVSNNL